MNKITLASKTLVTLFYAYLLWIPYSYIYAWVVYKYPINSPFWFSVGNFITDKKTQMNIPNLFTMQAPLIWKIAYSLETLIIALFYIAMTLCLIRLFKSYSKHVIFDSNCVRLIKWAGYYLFLINIAHLFCPVLNTYILSTNLQPTMSAFYFSMDEAVQLVISLFIIVVSWIMEESKKIHEEQQLTI